MIPKISVIIPVYNVEHYVGACLDSVCNQTLKNIEIICINDGSTDHSLQILENYAKQDPRIFIISQKNHGLSYSRNVGFNQAKGKYIYFLDSDDYIAKDCLELLSDKMESEGLEVLLFNAKIFSDDGVEEKRVLAEANYFKRIHNYPAKCSGEELFALFKENQEYIAPVSTQIYEREFLCSNELLFYDGIIHEDELYTFQCLLLASRAGYLNKQLYFRRVRDDSIMNLNRPEKMAFSVYSCFICLKEMIQFCLKRDFREKSRDAVFSNIERMAIICRYRYGVLDEEARTKVLEKAGKDRFFLEFFVLAIFNNNESIKQLKNETQYAKKELAESTEEIRQLKLAVSQKDKQNAESTEEIGKLKLAVSQKDKQNTENKEEIEKLKLAVSQKDKQNAENKEEIGRLKLAVSQKDKQNADNLKQLAKQQKINSKLGRELENIKNGWSFKVGRMITFIPRKIRDNLNYAAEHFFS